MLLVRSALTSARHHGRGWLPRSQTRVPVSHVRAPLPPTRMFSVRVRFAPSPTGSLHIGGLRTALFNYLFAKRMGGAFVLRIEDTDKTREIPGSIEDIQDMLEWCNIVPDEGPLSCQPGPHGPYIQSERLEIYHAHCKKLVDSGAAYPCFCSKERLAELKASQSRNEGSERTGYDGHCAHIDPAEAKRRVEAGEQHTIRLKVPRQKSSKDHHCHVYSCLCEENEKVIFNDELRGTINVDVDRIDDQVLLKSDGFPTYHLASVVDDHLMGITHVIRGEEWLLSTPKHVLLYDALGFPRPNFLHLPLLLNEDRTKMSKRKGDVSVRSFRNRGFTSDAMVNFVALLGWTPPSSAAHARHCDTTASEHENDDLKFSDLFSLEELIKEFSIEDLSSSPAVVSLEKLRWMNRWHIQEMNSRPDRQHQLISELRRSFLPACDHQNATVAGILSAMAKFNELDADKNGYVEGEELDTLLAWTREGLPDVDGSQEFRDEIQARLLQKMDIDGDNRLSFEEFEAWYVETKTGLLRLLNIAATRAADDDECTSSARPIVCRDDPEWPSDEYLSAAVRHLGKRLTSLAEFPQVAEYLFRAPCFKPGGAGGIVAAGMLAKEGGDAAAVSRTLGLLHESFAEEVGPEGSGTFESPKTVEKFVKKFAKKNGLKPRQLMFPARVALTGCAQGGGFYELIYLLGRAETLRRLEAFECHVREYVDAHSTTSQQ